MYLQYTKGVSPFHHALESESKLGYPMLRADVFCKAKFPCGKLGHKGPHHYNHLTVDAHAGYKMALARPPGCSSTSCGRTAFPLSPQQLRFGVCPLLSSQFLRCLVSLTPHQPRTIQPVDGRNVVVGDTIIVVRKDRPQPLEYHVGYVSKVSSHSLRRALVA